MLVYRIVCTDNITQGWFNYRWSTKSSLKPILSFGAIADVHFAENYYKMPESRHEGPTSDPKLRDWFYPMFRKNKPNLEYWHCAFESPEQLKKIFTTKKFRSKLSRHGVRLAVVRIDARHVKSGTDQCMFDRRKMKEVEFFPLDAIENME